MSFFWNSRAISTVVCWIVFVKRMGALLSPCFTPQLQGVAISSSPNFNTTWKKIYKVLSSIVLFQVRLQESLKSLLLLGAERSRRLSLDWQTQSKCLDLFPFFLGEIIFKWRPRPGTRVQVLRQIDNWSHWLIESFAIFDSGKYSQFLTSHQIM